MNLETTVKALYRIWKQPGKGEYKYVIYRGDEAIAKFKSQAVAELTMEGLVKAHVAQLYVELEERC